MNGERGFVRGRCPGARNFGESEGLELACLAWIDSLKVSGKVLGRRKFLRWHALSFSVVNKC